MEQNNNDQSLRDAVRDMQDTMRDRHQMMQQMLQTMQAMMARMEVQNHAQPIREEVHDEIDGVRSFGTEGRKKDGLQIPASDKINDYIVFRGSDIKDLQVKCSPPVQSAPIHNDPAIIQSHYSCPATASTTTSLPSVGSATAPDLSSHTAQLGLPRSAFQGSLPLYQPGGSLASWGSSQHLPDANGSGLQIPMYWHGYYTPSTGVPHLQRPPLLRPPPGLPISPSMQQQLQYSGINALLPSGSRSLPEFPLLLPPGSSNISLTSSMSSLMTPAHASRLAPETSASLMPSKPLITSHPAATHGTSLPFVTPLTPESVPTLPQNVPSIISSKPRTVPSPSVTLQNISQAMPSIIVSSSSSQVELSQPLVTPGQLLQPVRSIPFSSGPLQMSNKDVEIKPPEARAKLLLPEPTALTPAESKEPILPLPKSTEQKKEPILPLPKSIEQKKEPILPLPKSTEQKKEPILPLPKSTKQKSNGASLQTYHGSRGRGRGRRPGHPRPVTKFTEDFDFTAMNEKFKKDEVWGHLGRNKAQTKEREGEEDDAWRKTSIAATPFDFDKAESVRPKGHCVAVRVTSKDLDDGFKPTSGKVQELSFKSKPNVWAYFSVKSGGGIHEFSDSQFGHVFSFGESRALAIANMILGLKEIQIRGEIRTNVDYTVDLLHVSEYRDNKIHTGWLDSRIAMRVRAERPPWYLSVVGGALYKASTSSAAIVSDYVGYLGKGQIPPKHVSLVNSNVTLNIEGSKYTIEMVRGGPGSYKLRMNESELEVEIHTLRDGGLLMQLDGNSHVIYAEEEAFNSGREEVDLISKNLGHEELTGYSNRRYSSVLEAARDRGKSHISFKGRFYEAQAEEDRSMPGENSSLRSSFSEEGENDEDISSDQSLGQLNRSATVSDGQLLCRIGLKLG